MKRRTVQLSALAGVGLVSLGAIWSNVSDDPQVNAARVAQETKLQTAPLQDQFAAINAGEAVIVCPSIVAASLSGAPSIERAVGSPEELEYRKNVDRCVVRPA